LEAERRRVSVREVAAARGLPTLITATQDDGLLDVIARMRENAVSQLPVVDESGKLKGIVSEVELLDQMLQSDHDRAMTVGPMVNTEVGIAMPGDPLEDVLPELVSSKVIVLTDEAARPIGILTVIDALEYIASQEGN
jgi:predicted transcriptional regulator